MVKALILITALLITTGLTCKCPDYTPEYGACNSEFVIQAKVTGDEKANNLTTYQLQVERVFKNNAEFDEVIWGGRTLYASTPDNGACRIYLTKGELYLITGKITDSKVDVGGCDFVSVWTDLTEEVQKGFENTFYGDCKKKEVLENTEIVENSTITEVQNNNNTILEAQNSTLQLQNNALLLQNNTLQLQNNTLQLQNNILQLQNNTFQSQSTTIKPQSRARARGYRRFL